MEHNVVRTWVRGAFISLAVGVATWHPASAVTLAQPNLGKSADDILSAMPLSFEVNAGQFEAPVKYVARSPHQEIRFTSDAIKFDLLGDAANHPVTMTFAGHAPSPALGAKEIVQKQSHYFIGNDATQWRSHIPNFARVEYDEMYPGVDVAFYGHGPELEYDVIVAPGAELSQVRINFDGADRMHVTESGDLVLDVGERQWVHRKPVAYQMINGQRRDVDSRYVALNETLIGFAAGEFDHTQPLIVDPVIVASRYLKYVGDIVVGTTVGIEVTPTGEVVVAGRAESGPNNTGWNAYVAVLSADLTQVLSATWIGGTKGDEAFSLAVDGQGNYYITGATGSLDFPTTAGAFQRVFTTTTTPRTAFVTKLSSDGATLLYSTFLGGTIMEEGRAIAVDDLGAAYVAGVTISTNFPLAQPIMATKRSEVSTTFISKLSPAGNALEFSTYFGGSTTSNQMQTVPTGIAVDAAHNIYVIGASNSTNFPQVRALQSSLGGKFDAYLIKIGTDYQLNFSTLLGGAQDEWIFDLAVDDQQRVTLAGRTDSIDFPTRNAFQPINAGQGDLFVSRIDTLNPALVYSTYLGGTGYDSGAYSVSLDRAGIAYVVGATGSSNFPLKNPFRSTAVVGEAFIAAFGTQGELYFSSFLGGTGYDGASAVATAADGSMYIAGVTDSVNFPNTVGAPRPPLPASFITKLSKLELAPIAVAGSDIGVNEGELTTLDGSASSDPNGDAITYQWTKIAGPSIVLNDANSAQPTFVAPNVPAGGATLSFQLVVSDGALDSTPALVNVTVKDVNHVPVADAGSNQVVTEGSPVTLNGAQSYDVDGDTLTYQWQQVSGVAVTLTATTDTDATFDAPQVGSSGETLQFALTVNDGAATHTAYVDVRIDNVNHPPHADAGVNQTANEGALVTLDGSASTDPDSDALTYEWQQVGGQNTVNLLDNTSSIPTFTAPAVGLGGDTLEFELRVRDQAATSEPARVAVTILDLNDPPACDLASVDVASLWPPNHKLLPLTISGVRDPNDDSVTLTVLSVTSDEPVNGLGDGDTAPDAVITDGRVSVRAERAGTRNGRVYVVNFIATDTQGASCSGNVSIGVPQSKNSVPTNSGQSYDATRP